VAVSEQQLRQQVDDALDPVWPRERRRAWRRAALKETGHWLLGMAAIAALAVGVYLVFGIMVPWIFFVVIGILAAIAVLPDPDDQPHLKRRPEDPDGR
jgi:predicted PurR-regulated permease PerM